MRKHDHTTEQYGMENDNDKTEERTMKNHDETARQDAVKNDNDTTEQRTMKNHNETTEQSTMKNHNDTKERRGMPRKSPGRRRDPFDSSMRGGRGSVTEVVATRAVRARAEAIRILRDELDEHEARRGERTAQAKPRRLREGWESQPLKPTKHGKDRGAQRGISNLTTQLVLDFGELDYVWDGLGYQITDKVFRSLCQQAKFYGYSYAEIVRAKNVCVVTSHDNAEITKYRNSRRRKRRN